MEGIRIRPASEDDWRTLATLAEELMPREADTERRMEVLRQGLGNQDYELLVAETEGKIIGFVDQWMIHDFVHGANLGYGQNLYVSSEHRRRGIGSKLLQTIMANARAKGVSEVHVSTKFENTSAIRFYNKQGFTRQNLELEKGLR